MILDLLMATILRRLYGEKFNLLKELWFLEVFTYCFMFTIQRQTEFDRANMCLTNNV